MTPARTGPPTTSSRWRRAAVITAVIVLLLVAVEAWDAATGHRLDAHGIVPRTADGLWGILWAPLLHADFAHLIANVLPGAVLSVLLLVAGRFAAVVATAWVVSGLGVWLFGAPHTVTVGASGVVLGMLAYLIVRGLFTRAAGQVLVGLVLLALYGGVLWGVLPAGGAVSWQGHLFGAAGGVLAAWMLSGGDRRRRRPEQGGTTSPTKEARHH